MTITSLPLQNESAGQLGKSKVDGVGVYDADTKIKAAQWNQAVLRMIEIFGEVGLSDGSTAGSLNERMAAAEAQLATGRDDFTEGAGAWHVEEDNDGSVKAAASGTPFGMPSRGIVLLKAETTAGSKALIVRYKTGLILGPTSPIVVVWRFLIADRPADSSIFNVLLGLLSATENTAVGVQLSVTSSTITAALDTRTGGASAQESFTFPSGTYFDLRLTVSETGTTVEIATDGEPYLALLEGENAPTQAVYAPWAQVNRETSNGSGQIAIDFVDWAADRDAADAEAPPDDADPFNPVPVEAGTGLTLTTNVLAADFGATAGKVTEGNDSRLSDSRAPSGSAGGSLAGAYPNPTIAASAVTDVEVATANKDGASGTPSMRTLGTGAAQACAGNDSRLSDARAAASVSTGVLQTTTAALSGDLAFNAHKLTGVADPASAQDADTKAARDAAIQLLRWVVTFSGNFANGAAASITTYWENSGSAGYVGTIAQYPMPASRLIGLKVKPISNTMATSTVFTVMKNGVDTAITVTIGAGSSAIQTASGSVAFAEDDLITLKATNTNGNGNIYAVATVVMAPP